MRINTLFTNNGKDYYGGLSRYYSGKEWEAEQLMLKEIIEACKKQKWNLKVAVFPLIGDLSNGFKMKAGHDKVASFLKQQGVPYIVPILKPQIYNTGSLSI